MTSIFDLRGSSYNQLEILYKAIMVSSVVFLQPKQVTRAIESVRSEVGIHYATRRNLNNKWGRLVVYKNCKQFVYIICNYYVAHTHRNTQNITNCVASCTRETVSTGLRKKIKIDSMLLVSTVVAKRVTWTNLIKFKTLQQICYQQQWGLLTCKLICFLLQRERNLFSWIKMRSLNEESLIGLTLHQHPPTDSPKVELCVIFD